MKLITNLYSNVTSYIATLNRDTKGATAIEYAVIAGLMAAALIVAVAVLAGTGENEGGISGFFTNIAGILGGVGAEE
ncbi:Flp family type IVb pilin [Halomonas sp. MC140]|nr:Flp family type IVb pilin [Halomonas sp. MC140]MDN7130811.1 Flp family type IVb pilin [Halomonas sp. MC140]